MGFFTKRERNELDKLRERTVHEFVPPHQDSKTGPFVPQRQDARARRAPTAHDIGPLLSQTAGDSLQQIDDLIDGLQSMRDRLNDEAARVQREMIAYARFSQTTLHSTKAISEGLRDSFPALAPSESPTLSPAEPLSPQPGSSSLSEEPVLSLSEQPSLSPSQEPVVSASSSRTLRSSDQPTLSASEQPSLSPSQEPVPAPLEPSAPRSSEQP